MKLIIYGFFFAYFIYMKMKCVKNARYIVSIVLSIVFIFICSLMYSIDSEYVFSYHNEKVFYSGNKTHKNVSLMFNVYWGTEYIENILSILNKYDIKATFFIGGSWLEDNYYMMFQIYSLGHEIGNHGYLHKNHNKMDYNLNLCEIKATHNLIKEYFNIEMNLFAPPSGEYNNATIEVCNDINYHLIMWSKDTIDWRDQDTNLIYNRATSSVSNGDLVLMHPTEATIKALPMIITYLIANGYNIVTVSQNIFAV